jgi:uncharacterized protein YerC
MTKDVKDYEGLYFVNEIGEVFSYPKKTRKGIRKLLTNKHKQGYSLIDLCKDGKVKKHLVHRLVAVAFLDNIDNKEQVNHINGNKEDNRVENLEWNTRSENQIHSIRLGLRTTIGEKNSQSKINSKQVILILNDNRPYKEIQQDYKISISTISDIKRGYSWTHITGKINLKKENNRMQVLEAFKENGKTKYKPYENI